MEEEDGHWSIVPETIARIFSDIDNYQIMSINEKPPTRTSYFIKREFNSSETEHSIRKFIDLVLETYNNLKSKQRYMTHEQFNAGHFIGFKFK